MGRVRLAAGLRRPEPSPRPRRRSCHTPVVGCTQFTSHFPVPDFEVSEGGVMTRVGHLVDELLCALPALEVGEYSPQDCAGLVEKFARAEKALAAARIRAAARATESNVHRKQGFADPSSIAQARV